MTELENEQTETTAQSAEAQENIGEISGEVSLGKFKDTAALLSAYNSLQAEFTKRCQRIKELERDALSSDKVVAPDNESELKQNANITEEDKENVLKEYLQGVLSRKQKAVLLDGAGIGVKTPINRPKTIGQAGALAREMLEKNN
ncbi:MAG: hypothetical protein IKB30_01215 [Clostridia bacterium]|nr:hypothetical protein [Clostridia bacterium]